MAMINRAVRSGGDGKVGSKLFKGCEDVNAGSPVIVNPAGVSILLRFRTIKCVMEKTLTALGFVFIFNLGIKAQTSIANNTLDKFCGTWIWISGTDTVKLYLRKERLVVGEYFMDKIAGYHAYKQQNSIVESSFQHRNESEIANKTFSGTNQDGNDVLTGTLADIAKNKLVHLQLTLTNSGTQLTWESSHLKGTTVNDPVGYSLPQHITLVKAGSESQFPG